MLSGIAKRLHAATNERVAFVSANGVQRSDPLWNGLDYIAQRGEESRSVILAGRAARPYYSHMEGNRIIWRTWDKQPGEIRLTDEERAWAKTFLKDRPPFIVVEARFKASGGGGVNKYWPYWREAVEHGFANSKAQRMLGAEIMWMYDLPSFRHACAILERSIGYVGHEGGLHHAAAALGKPAVVVFGGYISPTVTGYETHTNLYIADEKYPLGCGYVTPCEHCREAMSKITVEEVVNAVKEMVDG